MSSAASPACASCRTAGKRSAQGARARARDGNPRNAHALSARLMPGSEHLCARKPGWFWQYAALRGLIDIIAEVEPTVLCDYDDDGTCAICGRRRGANIKKAPTAMAGRLSGFITVITTAIATDRRVRRRSEARTVWATAVRPTQSLRL